METIGNGKTVRGNTKTRTIPCKRWCFTFHYEKNDEEKWNKMFKNALEETNYIFANEIGNSGNTFHLQGYVEASEKIRPIEKLKLPKTVHWEKTKGTKEENIKYCSKENGTIHTNMRMKRVDTRFEGAELRGWQNLLLQLYYEEVNDRDVYWFHEGVGNKGKTFVGLWMMNKFKDVKVVTVNKAADAVMMMDEYTKMYILDIPRHGSTDVWAAVEQMKNGYAVDCKLKKEAKIIRCAPAHVVVLSNEPPPWGVLSEDRLISLHI